MKNKSLETEVYMTTTHNIRESKPKVSFRAVVNRVLVGAILLTTVATGVMQPAYAASTGGTISDSNTVTQNAENTIENSTYAVQQTISAIAQLQQTGIVDNQTLLDLASQLNKLAQAVQASNATSSTAVISTIMDAERVLQEVEKTEENSEGYAKANAALSVIKADIKELNQKYVAKQQQTTVSIKPLTAAQKKVTVTSFKDVTSKTPNYKAIMNLAKIGAIGGYKDGTFKPNNKITNLEFIGILMRAVDKTNASRAVKGADYDNTIIRVAVTNGIASNEYLTSATLTRANMALFSENAMVKMQKEIVTMQSGIERLIADYSKIQRTQYDTAIKTMYIKGILPKIIRANYNPSGTVTRAEAAAIINNVVNKAMRTNMSKVVIPTQTEINAATRKTTLLRWNDPSRALAKEGDTFLTQSGKKVVLTALKYNGETVVAYKQGLNLYGGMSAGGNGATFKVGDIAGSLDGDTSFLGEPYLQDERTSECHLRSQWRTIASYEQTLTYKVKNPKPGQIIGFTQFDKDLKMWCWIGPVF